MEKISVIIPLYNQKEFISQAIDSLLSQSYENIEIIVVNDGSTDEPFTELGKYENIINIINQDNAGLSAARNSGLKFSTGDYIQFLDADDFLHPDKLKLQLEFMMKRESRISYCEITQFCNDSNERTLRYIGSISDIFPHLYSIWHTYPLPIHSLLIKKQIFDEYGGFLDNLKASEDRFFLSLLALSGEKFDYFPFIGGGRRLHNNNMNKNRIHIYENVIKYYELIEKNDLAIKYFHQNGGFTCQQMKQANMTYFFIRDIILGTSFLDLLKIKKVLINNNINYYVEPIPNFSRINKIFPFTAFLYRFKRYLINKLR